MNSDYPQSLPHGYELQGERNKYVIDHVLGQGAFGITYLAKYKTQVAGQMGRGFVWSQVCIKEFFMRDLSSREEATGSLHEASGQSLVSRYRRAFLREARNLARMQHSNIVNVFEVIEANNTAYIVMEYIDGGNLDDYIARKGHLTEDEALRLFRPLCDAMNYMHAQHMLHLDLKPKNVMLDESGNPYLIDFGLSKQYTEDGEPESSTTIGLGTPGYAPSEQAEQRYGDTSFRATIDIYALGGTLYKMLTGETPPKATEISEAVLDGTNLVSEKLNSVGVSQQTSIIVSKAMHPSCRRRYKSVPELIAALGWTAQDYSPSSDVEQLIVDEETVFKGEPSADEEKFIIDDHPRSGSIHQPQTVGHPRPTPIPQKKSLRAPKWLWPLLVFMAALITFFSIRSSGGKAKPSSNVAPHPAYGSVKVLSEPSGASIYLDGKLLADCTTPDLLEDLSVGSHKVCLMLEGYEEQTRTVTVREGRNADISVTLTANHFQQPVHQSTYQSTQQVTEQPSSSGNVHNGHEYVDLGLSVKWATCNVGASTSSAYGSYYAWGETSPKSSYDWESYRFRTSGNSYDNVKFSKYVTSSTYGPTDNKHSLELSNDVARANWGGSWRIPSDAEWTELRDNCTWTWTSQGGHKGYKVTSKSNSNSIFLPAAGYRDGTTLSSSVISSKFR